jgi:hypothetical protein
MADPIHEPSHYRGFTNGAEVLDIAEHLNYCRGNIVKYVVRAGRKSVDTELQDLLKARVYLDREIDRLERDNKTPEGRASDFNTRH